MKGCERERNVRNEGVGVRSDSVLAERHAKDGVLTNEEKQTDDYLHRGEHPLAEQGLEEVEIVRCVVLGGGGGGGGGRRPTEDCGEARSGSMAGDAMTGGVRDAVAENALHGIEELVNVALLLEFEARGEQDWILAGAQVHQTQTRLLRGVGRARRVRGEEQ